MLKTKSAPTPYYEHKRSTLRMGKKKRREKSRRGATEEQETRGERERVREREVAVVAICQNF
jgi:hypothetical protein